MNHNDMSFKQLCALFNYVPKGRFLNTADAAIMLGISKSTLEHMRFRGCGLRYFQPNGSRRVWYSEVDVLRWMASGAKQSTSEAAA